MSEAMISVVERLFPSLSSQDCVLIRPSTNTIFPLIRYLPHISASFPKVTIRCHSVVLTLSPFLSFRCSSVAMVNVVTIMPSGVYLTSGSFPSLPTRIALLIIPSTFPEMSLSSIIHKLFPDRNAKIRGSTFFPPPVRSNSCCFNSCLTNIEKKYILIRFISKFNKVFCLWKKASS